jgi:hypothetical protein
MYVSLLPFQAPEGNTDQTGLTQKFLQQEIAA